MQPTTVGLIAAACATLGWLYTARRARAIGRKQHTINVMLQAHFNADFRKALRAIAPTVRSLAGPPVAVDDDTAKLRDEYRFVLNHYEFVASGLRNGDLDEMLIRDSERSTILAVFEACEAAIWKLRTSRERQTSYEHMEWINDRWKKHPPQLVQRLVEAILGHPLQGKRHDPNT